MTTFTALTAYGITIPRAFADKRAALAWAETEGHRWPGSRIVQKTDTWSRTIWKHEDLVQEKAA
jgi:hypothetical protein